MIQSSEEIQIIETHDECLVESSVLAARGLLDTVLSRYQLPEPVRCNFFRQGMNDTYVVHAGQARYYLRVYSANLRTQSEIEAEVSMLRFLRDQGIPVSCPIARKDGLFLTALRAPEGLRYACLFTNAPGRPVDGAPDKIRRLGQLAGRLHQALDKMPAQDRSDLDLSCLVDKPLESLRRFIGPQDEDYEYLSEVSTVLGSKIHELLPASGPQYGYCHGDLHGSNVRIEQDGEMTLFDFDCYGRSWRAYDLAVYLWSTNKSIGWSEEAVDEAENALQTLMDGYGEARPPMAEELEAIKTFVPLRHLWTLGLTVQEVGKWGQASVNRRYVRHGVHFIKQAVTAYQLL